MAKTGWLSPIKRIFSRFKSFSNVPSIFGGGWFRVFESYTGAWQHDIVEDFSCVTAYHAVFSCITLIASDIAKLPVVLKQRDSDGIWNEISNSAYSPVLRKPNRHQNRIQFFESWMLSKLTRGNAYILKERDNRGVVVALYVLDPCRVRPVVVPETGDVYYQLGADNMADIEQATVLPASEIIHDRINCLFHPLVGISPIYACGIAAMQGLAIQNNQTSFFKNRSMPGGILTAPGEIEKDTADRLKKGFDDNYSGVNAGKVAVLGDGLKFEPIAMTAADSQLIEQLKWSAETCCSCFHVPPWKIGVGAPPAYQNVQSGNVEYLSQALQRHIEDIEICLDEGLGMANDIGTEVDTDNLLRMDTATLITSLKEGISGAIFSPNEARKKVNLKPVKGGESPLLQQQNFSLAALAKRDASDNPFGLAPKADKVVIPPPDAAPAALPPPPKSLSAVKVRALFGLKEAA